MAERKLISPEELPSNSFKSKEEERIKETREKKVVEKVVTGKVVRKKKGLFKKLSEAFIGDDRDDVGRYIVYDVLIPAAKDAISDAVRSGVDMLLFGDGGKRDSRMRRDRGRSYTSYQSYYEKDLDDKYARRNRRGRNPMGDMDDILFETRSEAESVLDNLLDLLDVYGVVSVADFYDLAGIESMYTDCKWGWENLAAAYVMRSRQGFIIHLPKVKEID